MDEGAALEGEQGFAWVSVLHELPPGMSVALTGELVFEFQCGDGQAVQAKHDVYRVMGALLAEVKLPHDVQPVQAVQPVRLVVQTAGGPEVGQVEADAVVYQPVPQEVQGSSVVQFLDQPQEEAVFHFAAVDG